MLCLQICMSVLLHRKKIANENRIQSKKFKSDKKQQRRAKIDY